MTGVAALAVGMSVLAGMWLGISGAQRSREIDDHIDRFLRGR